nr:retrovirus-related Pol polyprotein from transposon TNT 1-94 [Tanacetum cinerariifolium]
MSYLRPFGCHVTILNTIDHLGKFEETFDEGFLVGYSLSSKAFRPITTENKANKTAGPKETNNSAGTARANSTNCVNTASTPVNTASIPTNQDDSQIPSLEDIYEVSRDGIFTSASYDDEGAVAGFINLETTVNIRVWLELKSCCWYEGSFKCWLITTPQMVINSPCLTDKKELAIPGQMTTGKELSNPLMADSLPKTTLPTKLTSAKVKTVNDEVRIQALVDRKRVNIKESSIIRTLRLDDAEGTGFSGEVTPLFENMLVQAPEEVGILQADAQSIPITTEPLTSKPKRSTYQKGSILKNLRVLKELKSVHSIDDTDGPVMKTEKSSKQGRKIADIDADVEINLEKAQAEAYNLDLNHQEKVLSMMDVNKEEPADVEEVLEVVKATKLMTKVVTTAGATKVSVPRKKKGVIIQDLEKTTTTATVQPKV